MSIMARTRGVLSTLPLLLLACPARGPEVPPLVADPAPTRTQPSPPIAKRIDHPLVAHGHERIDPYYWLRERDDPEVIAYLEAENAYTAAMTAHTASLRATLEAEMAARLVPDELGVPVRERDFEYYERWQPGADHPLLVRRPASGGDEQIMLDAQALSVGHEYFELGGLELSDNQQILAYSSDTVGRRIHAIEFVDLRSGERLPDRIEDVSGTLAWANDDRTLYYVRQDPETLREYQVLRHTLGQEPATDELVFEEADETFGVELWKTKSRRYLVIAANATLSSESWLLDANDPAAKPRLVQPRTPGLEYDVDHHPGGKGAPERLYVRTNLDAPDFRLMAVELGGKAKRRAVELGRTSWRELVAHEPGVPLQGFELFAGHLVLEKRRAGLVELDVLGLGGEAGHTIAFDDPTYVAWISDNREMSSDTLRFGYSSLTTPTSWFDYALGTRDKTLRKQTEVRGGFDPANYVSERLFANAPDGVAVPISLVRRRDTELGGSAPLLLEGYGAYGSSFDPDFSTARLSLLDRGFVYAIAHVRGGEELGRAWYDAGRLQHKRNTFTDFIACAEQLAAQGYGDPQRLFATGGSAGGLLIGAVVTMRPSLFRGAIAAVPFVDVVTTMLDDSIPLTTFEYDEWGNPGEKADYETMLAYSPYDNVVAQDYPALLVTAGLHDSQVQYWEPAKWVAKLRATKTGDHPLLLRTDMFAGHGGQAGRLESLEQVAFEYAFLLDLAAAP
jgi:oligopeptidase B